MKKHHRDEIQPCIIVKVNDVISPVLFNIFSMCILIAWCILKDILKRARVVPFLISGDSNMVEHGPI